MQELLKADIETWIVKEGSEEALVYGYSHTQVLKSASAKRTDSERTRREGLVD